MINQSSIQNFNNFYQYIRRRNSSTIRADIADIPSPERERHFDDLSMTFLVIALQPWQQTG
jgi:hypothetical protein